MAVVLSCVNLKGGVGKTALAVNFAAFCGLKGLKTLLIDLDPQTNATFSCVSVEAWQEHAKERGTVANLLGVRSHTNAENKKTEVEEVVITDVFANVNLIPSHQDLFTIDLDMSGTQFRESKLKKALGKKIEDYDIVICDCPPNLTIPTQNALTISTHYVVPVSPDFLSIVGVALLIKRVDAFGEDLGRSIENAGIVMSRVGRTASHRDMNMAGLKKQFGDLVIDQEIVERVKVSEAAGLNKPIFEMGDKKAAEEFTSVSEEVLKRVGLTK